MKPFLKVPTRCWSISGTGYFVVNHGVLGLCDDLLQNFRLYANYAGRFAVLVCQRPVWFTGVWATRVWPALLGSFLLLLQCRQALRLFVLALAGFLIAPL